MGFEPQIRAIVQKLGMPKNRQTVMTSATFPPDVQVMARDFLRSYSFLAVGRVGGTVTQTKQKLAWVEDHDKENFLFGIMMHQQQVGLTLIFVNTKQQAVDLDRFLQKAGFNVTSIHGDRTQKEREDALADFKSGRCPVLIATDVAARGLDIPNVALVVQFDLAMSTEDYVHRIGRTGRIGKKGMSIGMVNNRNKGVAPDLCQIIQERGEEIPPWLIGMAISTGNWDPYAKPGQQAYGGQDIRKSQKKGFQSPEEREAARRFGGFSKDAYGEGSDEKALQAMQTMGPQNEGSYAGAANNKKGGKKGKGKDKGKGSENGGPPAMAIKGGYGDSGGYNDYGGQGGYGGYQGQQMQQTWPGMQPQMMQQQWPGMY